MPKVVFVLKFLSLGGWTISEPLTTLGNPLFLAAVTSMLSRFISTQTRWVETVWADS